MLSVKDFNPKPLESGDNYYRFFGFPEVIKNEVAITHPECVMMFSHPVARSNEIAIANRRNWFIDTTKQLDGT